MKYAPIKAILLRNFRSLEEVIIDFTESPIVSVVGDNEAGKSSVTKALQTIGANLNPNTQRDYIRTDTDGFIIAVKFADDEDTTVVRLKSRSENGYRVQKGSNIVWSVSKMDSSDVPPEIQKYMGFVIEPETRELLNVRTYEDLMIFIHTSSSSNYKIIYNALKVDNILRAKRAGQNEINAHRKSISDAENGITTLTEELRKIKLVDLDPLLAVQDRIKKSYDSISSLESAIQVRNRVAELDKRSQDLKSLSEADTINELTAYTLNESMHAMDKLRELNKTLKDFDEINKLEEVDTNIIEKLQNALAMKERLDNNEIKALEGIERAEIIDINSMTYLERALEDKKKLTDIDMEISKLSSVNGLGIDISDISIFENAFEIKQRITDLNKEEVETRAVIKQLEDDMKQFGVLVATCPNCGETVIFQED